jgi:parallel beta-helix repeat protein
MNEQRSFERLFADRMEAERGSPQLPDSFYDDFRQRASHARQRPRWLALIKEPPMRISSSLAVGSPTARVAAIVVATLLLAFTVAGAGIAGSRLLAADGPIVVAQDGSGTVTTIMEAIAIAQDGDMILVEPGTYPESVVITEDITIEGDGDPGAVVIEFAADGPTHALEVEPSNVESFAYGILLDDSDAHVENITVRGHQNAAGSEKVISAVIIEGGEPVIEKLEMILDGDPGNRRMRRAIAITGGSSAVVRDSSWDGFTELVGSANSPRFEGNTVTAALIRIAGVGQNPTISGNTLLDGAGIVWGESGSSGTVEDNEIVGCITAGDDNDIIIRGNRIQGPCAEDPGTAAIIIESTSAVVVVDNEISDSPYGIQVASGSSPEISGNTIRGSDLVAIVLDNGTSPTIDGNTIEGNATGIAVRGATATPTLTGNTFCGNEEDLVVPDGSELTLEGNTVCET